MVWFFFFINIPPEKSIRTTIFSFIIKKNKNARILSLSRKNNLNTDSVISLEGKKETEDEFKLAFCD